MFGTQMNHEITTENLPLQKLIEHKAKLAHLHEIPIILSNYQVREHWFAAPIIVHRRETMEVCTEVLSVHLEIDPRTVAKSDAVALSQTNAAIVKKLLS